MASQQDTYNILLQIKGRFEKLDKLEARLLGIKNSLNDLGSGSSASLDKLDDYISASNESAKRLEAQINKVSQEIKQVGSDSAASFRELSEDVDTASGYVKAFGKDGQSSLRRIEEKVDDAEKQFGQLGRQVNRTGQETSRLGRIGEMALGVFTGNLMHRAIGMLKRMAQALVQNVLDTARSMDRIQSALALTNASFDRAKQFADRYSQPLIVVAEQYGRLQAAARGTGWAVEQTDRIFEAFILTATAMKMPQERLELVLLAVEQMMSKSAVSMEELRRQMGDSLWGAFNEAAAAIGKTTDELSKLISTGQLASTELLPKMAERLIELYGPKVQASLDGLIAAENRFKNAQMQLYLGLANNGAMDAYVDILDTFSETLQSEGFQKGLKVVAEDIAILADVLAKAAQNAELVWKWLQRINPGTYIGGAAAAMYEDARMADPKATTQERRIPVQGGEAWTRYFDELWTDPAPVSKKAEKEINMGTITADPPKENPPENLVETAKALFERNITDLEPQLKSLQTNRTLLEQNRLVSQSEKQPVILQSLQDEAKALSTLSESYEGLAVVKDRLGDSEGAEKARDAALEMAAAYELASQKANELTFTGQIGSGMVEWLDSLGTLAENVGDTISGSLQGGVDGLSSSLDDVIWKGGDATDVMNGLFLGIGQAFTQMTTQMIAQQIFAATFGAMLEEMGVISHAAAEEQKTIISAGAATTRQGIQAGETASELANQGIRVAGAATEEGAKTGFSLAGSLGRGAIRVGETIFEVAQIGIRTAAHILGETVKTAATLAGAAIRLPIIIAESIAYVIQAAIGAMSALASIPYVGPFLAVGAATAMIAGGMALVGGIAGFADGGPTGPGGRYEVAGIVHKGENVFDQPAIARWGGMSNVEMLRTMGPAALGRMAPRGPSGITVAPSGGGRSPNAETMAPIYAMLQDRDQVRDLKEAHGKRLRTIESRLGMS